MSIMLQVALVQSYEELAIPINWSNNAQFLSSLCEVRARTATSRPRHLATRNCDEEPLVPDGLQALRSCRRRSYQVFTYTNDA